MSVLRRAKLRTPDGIESIEYPLGVDAENVEVANGENLSQRLARIDEDLENNEEDIAAVSELAGTNKQNIGANEIRIDALERRSESVDKKPYYFDTVADMKADINLKAGDMTITLGYYEPNDGGGAEYKIVKGEYVDDAGSYHKLNNNLFAKLIIDKVVSPEQFGAYGDGSHDDTAALNMTFKNQNIQMKKNATYFVKYVDLKVPSTIVEGNNATISINTNIDEGQKSNGFGNFIYRDLLTYDTFIIKNLNFNGNFDTFSNYQNYNASQISFLLVSANKYKFAKIENCNFINCIQDALWVINTNKVEIIGNTFKSIATAQFPSMTGTLNAITAMSDKKETSSLLIKGNSFETVHDSAARIDDFGTVEFSNNICKDIRFVTCETFWNSRDYQCVMNIYNNIVNNASFFVTAGYEVNKELKKLDINIYNNNVKGLGFNQVGSMSSCGKFLSAAYGTEELNANIYNNIIEAEYTDGCLFYGSGDKMKIDSNKIVINHILNNVSYGNGIVNARELYFTNNDLKYDTAKQYNLFYFSKPSSNTRDVKAVIENNKIQINNTSRFIETTKDVTDVIICNNKIILNGENTSLHLLIVGQDNTQEFQRIRILNNIMPTKFIIDTFDNQKVLDIIIKNNIFLTETNLTYKISSIENKIINDNLLILE